MWLEYPDSENPSEKMKDIDPNTVRFSRLTYCWLTIRLRLRHLKK
jgi:hypothetical protein